MTAVPKPQYYTAEEYFALPDAPEGVITELHEGEIVALARPTRMHQRIASRLFAQIDSFIRSNHGRCSVDQEIDVKLTEDTVVVPDVSVTCDPSKLDEKRCNGAPDWVVEILSTNRSNDLIEKLALYQKAGVREYWIVDPKSEKTLVYFFERSDLPDIYTFDTPIPVGIYDKALSIRIADLLA
ncbi:MAG: Uma2 family endonuclease [Oscillospiraceae bacterium]|nr:Uma2 family endonuclease [Oscillospiraceae bacterium]